MSLLKINTHYGKPIEVNGYEVIPISRSLQILPKGIPVGFRWERPIGVLVQNEAGEEKVLPIEDVTRKAQVAVLLFTGALWLFIKGRMRKRRRKWKV
jgi:hypothetical protein